MIWSIILVQLQFLFGQPWEVYDYKKYNQCNKYWINVC